MELAYNSFWMRCTGDGCARQGEARMINMPLVDPTGGAFVMAEIRCECGSRMEVV